MIGRIYHDLGYQTKTPNAPEVIGRFYLQTIF
jgi:hypothetical protein